jgi:hypothetical protein
MRKIVTLIALMVFLSAYGQDEKSYQSHWHSADKNARQMSNDSYDFFKKGNFLYYISNDNSNLYIDIKIEDSGVQSKILQEGLTVWFNVDGRQHKGVGIRYPLGAKYADGPGKRNQGNSDSGSPLTKANTIQLIGFPGEGQNIIPAKNDDNFSGSLEYDQDGSLFYNLRLPIKRLSLITADGGAGFQPPTIGIEYGGMPEMGNKPGGGQSTPRIIEEIPSGGRGGSGGGRGGSGGGGRAGRGGSGGGMGAGPSGPSTPIATASKLLWIKKVSLADQP